MGATESWLIETPGVDLTGASMPGLRRHIVYRSSETGTMVAVLLDDRADLDPPVSLDATPARLGLISDLGILALVPEASPEVVCRVDVTGRLPLAGPG